MKRPPFNKEMMGSTPADLHQGQSHRVIENESWGCGEGGWPSAHKPTAMKHYTE